MIDSIGRNRAGEGFPVTGRHTAKDLVTAVSDQEVLRAVVEHYCRCLAGSDKAREALLSLGVDDETARAFRVGFSDRSLGPGLPGRQWKRGAELRAQLVRLGIYRPSGHEHFVGCLVVPVVNAGGDVVGICGRRLDRGRGELWADGLRGGWFNTRDSLPEEVLLARDIFDALAVVAAGHLDVVALGHPGSLSGEDAKELARRGACQVTVLGPGTEQATERLGREGIEVYRAGTRLDIAEVLSGATNPHSALEAVLEDAEAVGPKSPKALSNGAVPTERPRAAPTVTGDASELHISPHVAWR
jgi:hypothetical protein